ncbi:MAG: hypothetical protein KF724_06955 [Phycisphaeraceae bacterium]|nr:hypothetical protein [Phycisphaeraceae bacterium]
MSTSTTTKPVNETVTNAANEAAQACCRTAADAFKAGVEANQKLFTSMANSFSETFSRTWNPMAFNPMSQWATTTGANTMPAAFERMTQAMNTMVDANARFASECNALFVDAMRAHARTLERSGALMLNHFTGKTAKPTPDAAREIMDECTTFARQMSERTTKMTADHARQVSQVMDHFLTCKA